MAQRRKRSRPIRSEAKPPPSVIDKLGDDLLVEILIRLPNPRSAWRCKLVCKRWRSLISSPCFNRSFISHHGSVKEPRPLLILSDDATSPKSVIMSFMPPMAFEAHANFTVLDCFKDLLLCGYGGSEFDNNHELGRTYVVCNPFTKQWMALPLAPEKEVGYEAPVSRLVCEPCNLDLGDELAFAYSEYRFRVVCIYQHKKSIKLDVFCSEYGEWTNQPLVVLPGFRKVDFTNVVSSNGELLWFAEDGHGARLAAQNIFSLDQPATLIDASQFFEKPRWDISVSQGAVHIIALEEITVPARVSVWRLEESRKSWKKQCEGFVKTSGGCDYELQRCMIVDLHPENPEIVLFQHWPSSRLHEILSCDLRKGYLEFFSEGTGTEPRWTVFQPRVHYWPTPIPRFEELRVMYDGSYKWFKADSYNCGLSQLQCLRAARKEEASGGRRLRITPVQALSGMEFEEHYL